MTVTVAPRGLAGRFQRRYAGSLLQAIVDLLRELGFVNSITLFGAAFLLSALPFIILMSSFANRRVEDDLSRHLGLNAQASRIVEQLFSHSASRSTSAIVIAVALSVVGAAGVAGTLQNDYERIFGATHHGTGNGLRLLIWAAGFSGWFMLEGLIAAGVHPLPAGALLTALAGSMATASFFWWSMHFLLAGNIGWPRLRLPAVVTAAMWLALQGIAVLYFSSTITSDSRLYGTIGAVFSLLTWFIAIGAVILAGAVTGEVWQRRRQQGRLTVARVPR
jgi:membrane protein